MPMPLRTSLSVVFVCLWILAQPSQDAQGKGPGGKGGGRGGAKSQGGFPGASHAGSHSGRFANGSSTHDSFAKPGGYPGSSKVQVSRQADIKNTSPGALSGGDVPPWSMQRMNEEGKLNHRLGVADQLDRIAEQNGNANLQDAAQRKREKARQLYEKRMAKIGEKDAAPAVGDESQGPLELPFGPADSASHPDASAASGPADNPVTSGQKFTGRENALDRQLRNEQRKLARQMETADRLWDAYEQTGDEQLADLAQAVEDRALSQYQTRMDSIRDFQDRHGLSDMIGDAPLPEAPLPGLPGGPSGRLTETIGPLLDLLP